MAGVAVTCTLAAMTMVGHKTESVYRRYAIVDAGVLRDAASTIDHAVGTIPGTTSKQQPASEKTDCVIC